MKPTNQEFWNSRAHLGSAAGSQDLIAKQLEMNAIASYVRDGMKVLDVGCGNGITAFDLARRFDVEVSGIDFALEMIEAANILASQQQLKGSACFHVGDVRNLANVEGPFDLIYSERMLINLPDWTAQRSAIESLAGLLNPGGLYVMCESSQDGLDAINQLREKVGLEAVIKPWHNCYLRESEVEQADIPGLKLEEVNCFSSTYYFLSRVVNAALAVQVGQSPLYDAPVNQLALQLPPIGTMGQGKIWLWRKDKEHD